LILAVNTFQKLRYVSTCYTRIQDVIILHVLLTRLKLLITEFSQRPTPTLPVLHISYKSSKGIRKFYFVFTLFKSHCKVLKP